MKSGKPGVEKRLSTRLCESRTLWHLIRKLGSVADAELWVGGGVIAQTLWNLETGRVPGYGIRDIDVVYFDADDLSENAESRIIRRVESVVGDAGIPVDVKNQARVHLWYERRFGYPVEPYVDLEDAIASWPTTAAAVAIRCSRAANTLRVIAPFGLDDLLSLRIVPNRRQITSAIYRKYLERWTRLWPELQVEPW